MTCYCYNVVMFTAIKNCSVYILYLILSDLRDSGSHRRSLLTFNWCLYVKVFSGQTGFSRSVCISVFM